MNEITSKLSEISLMTSDAVTFVQLRFMLERMEELAAKGDSQAAEVVGVVEKFYRLCKHAESK